jgi:acetyl-CoA acetyltransferase
MSPARFHNDVAIVGSAYSEISRSSKKTLGQLAVDACTAAIEDAGLVPEDIDGLSNYPNPSGPTIDPVDGVGIVGVNYISQALKLSNLRWSCSITGGTITASMVHAVYAVNSGGCDYALVWRGMHNPGGPFGRVTQTQARGEGQFSAPWGFNFNVIRFAQPYSRYMAKYGTTREDHAAFMVRNRRHAAENPDSVFRGKPITVEDYLRTRMIAEPLSLLDCDMAVDGCGALVLTTAERARDLKQRPVYVKGCTSGGIAVSPQFALTLEDFRTSGDLLARALWKSSDMSADDITHIHVYDGFSYFPPLWMEIFGFYPEGEGVRGLQDEKHSREGALPVNTSGGALGMGRLHGTPQVIEATRQIQRRAGDRQISNPAVALVHTGGPFHGCGALILSE